MSRDASRDGFDPSAEHERDVAPAPEATPEREPVAGARALASTVGNQAFGQLIGRAPGAGVLAGGGARDDVGTGIATSRGSGHTLDTGTRERLAPHVGDPLQDVR